MLATCAFTRSIDDGSSVELLESPEESHESEDEHLDVIPLADGADNSPYDNFEVVSSSGSIASDEDSLEVAASSHIFRPKFKYTRFEDRRRLRKFY